MVTSTLVQSMVSFSITTGAPEQGQRREEMEERNQDCWKPIEHPKHMCRLLREGLMQELDQLADNPVVRCARCGAEANLREAVCQPLDL